MRYATIVILICTAMLLSGLPPALSSDTMEVRPDAPGEGPGRTGGPTRFELRTVTPAGNTITDRTVAIGEHLVMADGKFTVIGNLTVSGGAMLTIRNATVLFWKPSGAGTGLRVDRDGRLSVEDSQLRNDKPGDWYDVAIYGSMEGSSSAFNGTRSGLRIFTAQSAVLTDCEIINARGPGVMLKGASAVIRNCTFWANEEVDLHLKTGSEARVYGGDSTVFNVNVSDENSHAVKYQYLRVKVVDVHGTPFPGVDVTVWDKRGAVAGSSMTGDDGRTPYTAIKTHDAGHAGGTSVTSYGHFTVAAFTEELGINSTEIELGKARTVKLQLDGSCRPPGEYRVYEGYVRESESGRPLGGILVGAMEAERDGEAGGYSIIPAFLDHETALPELGELETWTLSQDDGYYRLEVPQPGYDVLIRMIAGDGWRFGTYQRLDNDPQDGGGSVNTWDINLTEADPPFNVTVIKDGERVPLHGTENVSVETDMRIRFKGPIDPGTLEDGIVFRSPSGEYAIAGNEEGIIPVNISYDPETYTATLETAEPLKGDIAFSTEHIPYYLTVTTAVRNATGGGPALWEDWTGRFEADFPDRDGDGVSDRYDDFPDDPTQQVDSDEDNWGDDPDGNNPDAFPYDHTQWADADGDGYGDNPKGTDADDFPADASAHRDTDGDGRPDTVKGQSSTGLMEDDDDDNDGLSDEDERLKGSHPLKPDTDGDGVGDLEDPAPSDPTVTEEDAGDGGGGGGDAAGLEAMTVITIVLVFVIALLISLAALRAARRKT